MNTDMFRLTTTLFLIACFSTCCRAQLPVHHYSFTDTAGNDVRLSDFSGKLIVLDLWYTGCSGCAYFFQQVFSDIKETFKADTNVIFLSISADQDRKQWLESVKTGAYTNDSATNLYTGGKSFYHDMLVQQNVTIYPHFQIIDQQGNVVCIIRKPFRLNKDILTALIKSCL